MKESMWGYYLALMGITVSTIMVMVTNMTTTDQQNYYLLKEVASSAMVDAIDHGYYTEYGEMKINKEKFVENFLRRFSESISKSNTYKIDFYSIYENPPSVSIKVTSNTGDYNIAGNQTNINVINTADIIMESNNAIVESQTISEIPYSSCDESMYITNDDTSEDYGYCRMMQKFEFNMEDNSEFLKNIIDKLKKYNESIGLTEVFDIKKLKVLDSDFLHLLTKDEFESEFGVPLRGGPKSVRIDSLGYNAGSTFTLGASLADVNGIGNTETSLDYMAVNVKNIVLDVVKDDDTNKFFLAYSFDFNCNNSGERGPEDLNVFKTYRREKYRCEGIDVTKDHFDNLSANDKNKCEIEYYFKGEGELSDPESEGFVPAPYYNACIIGFKFKVDFYYDTTS